MESWIFEEYQKQLQDYEKRGLEALQVYANKAIAVGVSTEFTQNSGNPGRTICEMAQIWGADLIVIGHRGLSRLNELLLGSVSNYVLHHAPCAVFTVHNQSPSSADAARNHQATVAAL